MPCIHGQRSCFPCPIDKATFKHPEVAKGAVLDAIRLRTESTTLTIQFLTHDSVVHQNRGNTSIQVHQLDNQHHVIGRQVTNIANVDMPTSRPKGFILCFGTRIGLASPGIIVGITTKHKGSRMHQLMLGKQSRRLSTKHQPLPRNFIAEVGHSSVNVINKLITARCRRGVELNSHVVLLDSIASPNGQGTRGFLSATNEATRCHQTTSSIFQEDFGVTTESHDYSFPFTTTIARRGFSFIE